ncbi:MULTISPECIES: acyltransferase [unclassified Mesorhizobium]|uniref:acyltransferase family protein n=1 Tax=unclassified Mesorhizobium TaxID=325217 RepID=UPI0012DD8867|nr:acyltransferase [Mesorhizobium sp. L103C565B0]
MLLALGVMFGHADFGRLQMTGGLVGVQAFYMVSGFYMGLILGGRYKSAWLFYSNRALRIYPTYWLVLALTFVYVGIDTYIGGLNSLPSPVTSSALAGGLPVLFTLTKDSRIDRLIGELSYPLYISHLLVLEVMRTTLPISGASRAAAVFVICIAFAALLAVFVEMPFRTIRDRRLAASLKAAHPVQFSGALPHQPPLA